MQYYEKSIWQDNVVNKTIDKVIRLLIIILIILILIIILKWMFGPTYLT